MIRDGTEKRHTHINIPRFLYASLLRDEVSEQKGNRLLTGLDSKTMRKLDEKSAEIFD